MDYCIKTGQAFINKEINREFIFKNIEILDDKSKFYRGLYSTYAKDETSKYKYKLLENIAFYNFFQTIDKTVSGNVRKNEYLQAWSIFHQVINVIQPDICIFHGISSHHHMQYYFESQNIDFEWRDVEENNEKSKINGATPILASIDNKTKVLFCKHPSIRYTVELWRNFIFQNFPELNIIQG